MNYFSKYHRSYSSYYMGPVYTYIYIVSLQNKCHNKAVLIVNMSDDYKPDEYLPTIDVCPKLLFKCLSN